MILLLLFYLLVPAAVIRLFRKAAFLNRIGPILLLYIIGIIVGYFHFLPAGANGLQELLT